jgi:hypothetical protein
VNRLIRSTACPARAKIEARAKRTARCDKFPRCLWDRACLIEAPAGMRENDARTAGVPRAPARQQPNYASPGEDEIQVWLARRQGGDDERPARQSHGSRTAGAWILSRICASAMGKRTWGRETNGRPDQRCGISRPSTGCRSTSRRARTFAALARSRRAGAQMESFDRQGRSAKSKIWSLPEAKKARNFLKDMR